jgi:hypothetical protein
MDSIALGKHSPKAFILAANTLSGSDAAQDQVWSLAFNPSGPHPFHLHTTFGLQARLAQVFPNILSENTSLLTEENYRRPPKVSHYSPGFIKLIFQLKTGLEFTFSALTPEPSILLGTISLENRGENSLGLILAILFHLLPLEEGLRSHPEKMGVHHILSAQVNDLSPVLFMSSGPTSGNTPLPALSLPIDLKPGELRSTNWALAARRTQEESFEIARRLTALPWDQFQQSRLMDQARQTLQVKTGNSSWDAAFSLAQIIPYTHFIHHNPDDPTPAVVRTRLPDQPAITAQTLESQDDVTTLELNHLAQTLLPQRPDLLASLVLKTLNRLREDGKLMSKRNTSPFVKPFQEPPVLAALCLEIFEITCDQSFLKKVFPLLCKAAHSWLFTDSQPKQPKPFTWQNLDQCQLHSGHHPFDIWEETGRGLGLQFAESPAVLAMLLREVRSLKKMAELLEDLDSSQQYGRLERTLHEELDGFWNDQKGAFQYRDVQSKRSPEGEMLINDHFHKAYVLNRQFNTPQRLICHLETCDERTRACQVSFKGLDEDGRNVAEVFKPYEILWVAGRSHLTTKSLFHEITSITVKGLKPEDQIRLETADLAFHDITCMAPLWSGRLPKNRLQTLIKQVSNGQRSSLTRGIPEVDPHLSDPPKGLEIAVNVLWNTLIIQGLVKQGLTEAASEIFSSLMASITHGLGDYDGFYPYFRLEDGRPLGKPNVIMGLAPLRLCLEIAGIRILTPNRVALWGRNPFPWPIEVNWQGLSVYRAEKGGRITFPNGSTSTYEGIEPVLISQDQGEI